MTAGSRFLIRFGWHGFVSHSRIDGENHFTVDGGESQKMIAHAANLIEEMFHAPSTITVR